MSLKGVKLQTNGMQHNAAEEEKEGWLEAGMQPNGRAGEGEAQLLHEKG